MSHDVVARLTHLVHEFDARVQATPPTHWNDQSPCAEWTARDVVVHIADNLQRVAASLGAGEATGVQPDDDIVAAWDVICATFLGAIATADLTAEVNGPFGPMPAEQLLGRFIATDVLVHTWDLARAVGLDEHLDPDAVAHAYEGLRPMDVMIRRPGVFGPKREPPPGADLQTELLCFLGRPA